MQQMSGANLVIECLKREGVGTLFAYPGACSLQLHQALIGSGIRVVLPRHEQGGCFAAIGYARYSGCAGCCIATSGPGATNLVTAIADAYMDSIPLVVITSQVNQHLIGKNAFQETDIIGMTRLIVKHSYLVLSVADIPSVIKDAFFLAGHGRPGPVVVDITVDVLSAQTEPVFPMTPSLRAYSFTPPLPSASLNTLHKKLRTCQRPCILAGGGVIHANASRSLREFAERWQIPVATSLMGIGSFPESHPLSLGMLGMHGTYYANKAVNECDLLLAIGVRFSDRVTGAVDKFAPHAFIVHVDVDDSEINKNKHADLPLLADADQLIARLLPLQVKYPDRSKWFEQIGQWRAEHPMEYAPSEAIRGAYLVEQIRELTHGNAIVVTGVGQHQMWAAQCFGYERPRQFLTSGGLGAMGFGLPVAIGAAIAAREAKDDTPVILMDGDGSFQMNIQELATLFAEGLPLKMILFNNQFLGLPAQLEDYFYQGNRGNTDLNVAAAKGCYPDFVTIAKGYGIPAQMVCKKEELPGALRQLLETPDPGLLDVHILVHDAVLPMIPSGKNFDSIIC